MSTPQRHDDYFEQRPHVRPVKRWAFNENRILAFMWLLVVIAVLCVIAEQLAGWNR